MYQKDEFVYYAKLKKDGYSYEDNVVAKILGNEHPKYSIEVESKKICANFKELKHIPIEAKHLLKLELKFNNYKIFDEKFLMNFLVFTIKKHSLIFIHKEIYQEVVYSDGVNHYNKNNTVIETNGLYFKISNQDIKDENYFNALFEMKNGIWDYKSNLKNINTLNQLYDLLDEDEDGYKYKINKQEIASC